MELSCCNMKILFTFSQKKVFLIFQEMELSYILGNGNTEKIPYFSGKGFFLLHEEPKFLIFLQKKVKNKFF